MRWFKSVLKLILKIHVNRKRILKAQVFNWRLLVFTYNGEEKKIELEEGWLVHRLLPALYAKMYKV